MDAHPYARELRTLGQVLDDIRHKALERLHKEGSEPKDAADRIQEAIRLLERTGQPRKEEA